MKWRARQFAFEFPGSVRIMGILNVTPDSFSDGGRYFDPEAAMDRGLKLVAEGTDILDIGGESTRPDAEPVSETEELRRVIPVIERLAGVVKVPISIDTMKPGVARQAIHAGASIVNDVAAHRADPEMWRLVAETGAGYVAMHMQGTPQTMQRSPAYGDVVEEVNAFFGERLSALHAAGVLGEQVVLDPGIGFGKMPKHNLQLLARFDSFTRWKRPLLLGVSRKSFIPRVTGEGPTVDRLAGSLACTCWAVERGLNVVRTHDVVETRQALRLMDAIRAENC